MSNKFDVIIVGAGPAGLKCAEQLVGTKFQVLIIEKNKVIGPKVCGGGLTDLVSEHYFPKSKTRMFSSQVTYLNKLVYKVPLIKPIRTIDREDLAKFQLEKIKNANNIKILTDTKVISIKDNQVATHKEIFSYKFLVGADGSNSVVRRYLGLKSRYCYGVCVDVPVIVENLIWIFYPKKLKTGYIWVFPHKRYTNIGVYFDLGDVNGKLAKEILRHYLKENNYEYNINRFKGGSINYLYRGYKFDNIFLIGDAAGLTSRVWGEGIPYALISGEEIGKKIINPCHKMKKFREYLKIKKKQEILGIFIKIFPTCQHFFIKLFIKLMYKKWFQYFFGAAKKDNNPI